MSATDPGHPHHPWLAVLLAVPGVLAAPGCPTEEQPTGQAVSLEFRILANQRDDAEALEAAKKYLADAAKAPKLQEELRPRARDGLPPPPLAKSTDKAPGYTWFAIGPALRRSLNLDNEAAAARARGEPLVLGSSLDGCLLYSRPCESTKLSDEERKKKRFDYFLLTRDPRKGKAVTGAYLVRAKAGEDAGGTPCVLFSLNKEGGVLLRELTSANLPSRDDGFKRHLAILLDGVIVSAPTLNAGIGEDGMITGRFTHDEVEAIARLLRGVK
jgi:hypothetical protein